VMDFLRGEHIVKAGYLLCLCRTWAVCYFSRALMVVVSRRALLSLWLCGGESLPYVHKVPWTLFVEL